MTAVKPRSTKRSYEHYIFLRVGVSLFKRCWNIRQCYGTRSYSCVWYEFNTACYGHVLSVLPLVSCAVHIAEALETKQVGRNFVGILDHSLTDCYTHLY